MSTNGLAARARELYERAVFGGDEEALTLADRELDAAEADLALARGRVLHARFLQHRGEGDPRELALFEQAAELYRRLGNASGEAEALFWTGCYHQVVQDSHSAALPFLERSYQLADSAGDDLTRSYAVRHLAFADLAAGDAATARRRFEESVRLRREIGFAPGVAADCSRSPSWRRRPATATRSWHFSTRPSRSPETAEPTASCAGSSAPGAISGLEQEQPLRLAPPTTRASRH